MTTPYFDPRAIDNMLACRQSRCNNRGTCVTPPGAGTTLMCDCDLGYKGDSCKDKVSGALSVPLTLSMFFALIGLVVLAVIAAKFWRSQWKKQRKLLEQNANSKAP